GILHRAGQTEETEIAGTRATLATGFSSKVLRAECSGSFIAYESNGNTCGTCKSNKLDPTHSVIFTSYLDSWEPEGGKTYAALQITFADLAHNECGIEG